MKTIIFVALISLSIASMSAGMAAQDELLIAQIHKSQQNSKATAQKSDCDSGQNSRINK